MSNNPRQIPRIGETPVSGTFDNPVNGLFTGPDAQGFLDDLPPQSGFGAGANKVVTAVGPPKLGLGTEVSPKTHG